MILTRVRLLPQERFDLEDLNAMLAGVRADAKYNIKNMLSNQNYVINGFTVTGIGFKSATVNMSQGTFIFPENTNDFSWYTTAPAAANVTIPDAQLVNGTRNYVEMSLLTQNNTPVTRAFWDPEAQSGEGIEFNQIVNTMTDLKLQFTVATGGFSGSADRLPLCIIDTDSSGNIKLILDERRLFHRLATPDDVYNEFSWGTKREPPYTMTLNGVTGTFSSGEQVAIGTETATVLTGGTSSITFNLPSGKDFFYADSVVGQSSGATGTVNTVSESFSGVDKSVKNLKEDLDAIKTEILKIKTDQPGFWWQSTVSITELQDEIDAILAILNNPSYNEYREIVTSGATGNQLVGPVTTGTTLTLPNNSRLSGSPAQNYVVGKGALEIYLNGQVLERGTTNGWTEVGTIGNDSTQIVINQQLEVRDILTFRIDATGGPGPGGTGSATPPGGVNGDIQFNLAGSFSGNASFKIDTTDGSLNLNGLRQSLLSTSLTLANNVSSPTSIFNFVAATYRHAVIEYSISRNGSFRTGHFLICNDGTLVGYNDSYVNTADVGITLTADISGANVRILYASSNSGFTGVLKLSMRRWS